MNFVYLMPFDLMLDHQLDDLLSLLHYFSKGHIHFNLSQHIRFVVDLLNLSQIFHNVIVVDRKGDILDID